MFDLTQEELNKMSYAQLCTLVLEQQQLLKLCKDTLGKAIEQLNTIKELAQ